MCIYVPKPSSVVLETATNTTCINYKSFSLQRLLLAICARLMKRFKRISTAVSLF